MTSTAQTGHFHSFPAWQAAELPQQRPQGQGERAIRRVLVSVSDKTGLLELGHALAAAGVEVVSTGGTATALRQAGLEVVEVSQLTGFPEMLEGRVKTLHPRVHAGLLADMTNPEHARALQQQGIEAFDALVVNLYPFAATVASGADAPTCVENIDIGGPAMIRAAAKNHRSIAVITDSADYALLAQAAASGSGFTQAQRQQLAAKAFAHTASYDTAVATWMAAQVSGTDASDQLPAWVGATWTLRERLRYGENPHQAAALYVANSGEVGIAGAQLLHGKAMSYNNFVDADAALRAAYDFTQPCVAIIKHNNPCGIAVADTVEAAHAAAHACDSLSAFGGVIAANRPVTAAMASQVAPIFTEVVVAPGFEPEALQILTAKKNLRLLLVDASVRDGVGGSGWELRPISGGLLVQQLDQLDAPGDPAGSWTLACGQPADSATLADLEFAWRASRAVKSNAIVLAHAGATVGVGMGQVNRVDSARLAVSRAGQRAAGSVAASDGFFPFPDGLQVLLEAGVRAVVQPGGSLRDEEVIAAAQAAGATLYLTGTRHFAH